MSKSFYDVKKGKEGIELAKIALDLAGENPTEEDYFVATSMVITALTSRMTESERTVMASSILEFNKVKSKSSRVKQ